MTRPAAATTMLDRRDIHFLRPETTAIQSIRTLIGCRLLPAVIALASVAAAGADAPLRYGQVDEHNAQVPRDHWLEDWERRAIVNFEGDYPLEGYRRLTFMMNDAEVVAAAPATVYRVLKAAGRIGTGTSTSRTSTSPARFTSYVAF